MKSALVSAGLLLFIALGLTFAQHGGGAATYGGGGGKQQAEQLERQKHVITKEELPPSEKAMYVEANVLMNVKADEYVAMFAIAQESPTIAESNTKMDAVLKDLTGRLRTLGVPAEDIYVDFISQNKIYEFELVKDIAKEKLAGFELKKNISIRYEDPALLDKLLTTAAQVQVFDLVKVDYVVKDVAKVQDQVMQEAAKVIKQKTGRYDKLLGTKLQASPQIVVERPAIHYPTEMYDDYRAFESENIGGDYYRQRYTIHGVRKTHTAYFNGLDADGFDTVVNPVMIEPMVQFTLYLKVKYDVALK